MNRRELGGGLGFLEVSIGDSLAVRVLNGRGNESNPQSCGHQTDGCVDLSGLLRDLWRESGSFAQGDEERITPETSLIGDLVADSLDVVEITMELEEAFDVEFGDDAVALTTVQQIVDYIQTKLDDQR